MSVTAESYLDYSSFGTRNAFNEAIRFFKTVTAISGSLKNQNLSDIIWDLLQEEKIGPQQVPSVYSTLLIDKLGYSAKSINFLTEVALKKDICSDIKDWTSIDLNCIYYSATGYPMVFNPKNKKHINEISKFNKDFHFVVYARDLADNNTEVSKAACEDFLKILLGKPVKNVAAYTKKIARSVPAGGGTASKQKIKKQAAVKPKNMLRTDKLGVVVSNELFHNGNVEAWTRIIKSYSAKYPDNQVKVFYDGELIKKLA
ncbi:MAG TPA: hypothetical protein VKS21_00205, partial [Spirochaetota bacterium]|nr:hypothetical protein [Spirochaetota bacterium]